MSPHAQHPTGLSSRASGDRSTRNGLAAARRARRRRKALRFEDLEPRTLLTTVSLGDAKDATGLSEGFGFGSTIDGLGSALNLSATPTTSAVEYSTKLGSATPVGIAQSNAFTQEFWLYPQPGALGSLYRFVSSGPAGLGSVSVSDSGKDITFSGLGTDVALNDVLNPNAWNHVAETFDGTTINVYVNGNTVYTSQALAGTRLIDPTQLIIGGTKAQPGALDELRIWNVARSQAEVQKGMLDLPAPDSPGLVGNWKFDGDLGDATGKSAPLSNASSAFYVNNPAPQIGFVTVKVTDDTGGTAQPVNTGIGLFVTYAITGGSATEAVDYTDPTFRTDAFSPSTEKHGIIIPDGQSTGRIYFMARNDAQAEPTESINVQLTAFSFASSSYKVSSTASTASLTIADNGAYTPGVAAFDATGRAVSTTGASGAAAPLYVAPTGSTEVDIALTSQPSYTILLQVTADANTAFAGAQSSVILTFSPDNWDKKQPLFLTASKSGAFNGTIRAVEASQFAAYLPTPVVFQDTNVPSNSAQVGEGSAGDGAPITPTVNLVSVHDAVEGIGTGALMRAQLDSPAPAGGLDVKYSYSITAATSVNAFSGGDVGDGLDLDGNLVYAVGMYGTGLGQIRDATFTSPSTPGVSFNAPSFVANYFTANFGSSPNDLALKALLQGVRFTSNSSPLTVDLANLTPGVEYKLQLLFVEGGSNRGFDVLVNGQNIADDLNVGQVQGGASNRTKGVVVTDTFVATDTVAHIVLDGQKAPYPDHNPILSAFTLEQLPTHTLTPLSGKIHVAPGARTADLPIVVDDNDAVEPDRTVAVTISAGTGYKVGASPTASVLIHEDDRPGLQFSNFTQTPVPTTTSTDDTLATANDLGVAIPGKTAPIGLISSTNRTDFDKFTIDRSVADLQSITFRPDASAILELRLLNASGGVLRTIDGSNAVGPIDTSSLAAGTYYLQVVQRFAPGPYSIVFGGSDAEPNDTLATAVNLGIALPGVARSGILLAAPGAPSPDTDVYKFLSDDNQVFLESVTVNVTVGSTAVSLILYNAAGQPIDSTSAMKPEATGYSLTLGMSAASKRGAGVYYLRVTGANATSYNAYTVSFAGMRMADYVGVFSDSYSPIVLQQSPTDPVSQQFGLRLESQPFAPVTLTFTTASSGQTDAAKLSTKSLIFTPTNWNTYQLVTVSSIDNPVPTGLQDFTITAIGSSSDPQYANRTIKFDVLVEDDQQFTQPPTTQTTQDPNLPRAVLIGTGASVTEGGSLSFAIGLSKKVTTDTYVGISFDPTSTVLGRDFTAAGLVTDQKPYADAVTALSIGGSYNVPRFVDLNGDGLPDLVVGSASGPLRVFKNVGGATIPKFVEKTGTADDPFAGLATGTLGGYLVPAFADVDGNGNGTVDLLLGSKTGLAYFRNDGDAKNPKFVAVASSSTSNPFAGISPLAGQFFAPTLADLFGKGKPDLYLARQGVGTVTFFQNTDGTFKQNDAASPVSELGIGLTDTPTISFADINGDGRPDAILGLSTGSFARLNAGTATSPSFPNVGVSRFFDVSSAIKRPSWAAADIDGDGVATLYAGGSDGKLYAFQPYLAVKVLAGSVKATVLLNVPDNQVDEGGNRTIDVRLLQSPGYILDANTAFPDVNDLNGNGVTSENISLPVGGGLIVLNNDKAGILAPTPADSTVNEIGKTQSLMVSLNTKPRANVSVYVSSSDPKLGLIGVGSAAGVAMAILTFTPDNWNTPQTVKVLGVSDAIDDGDRPFRVAFRSSSADTPYDSLAGPSIAFTHINNDTAGITVSSPRLTLQGRANGFSVVLNTQPVGSVRVTMTPADTQIALDGGQAGAPETLSFDASDWNLPRYVQITAPDNGLVQYFHTGQIRFSVQSGRLLSGPTAADNTSAAQAYDLGTLTSGFTWSNIPLSSTIAPAPQLGVGGAWYKITLARPATSRETLRLVAPATAPSLLPTTIQLLNQALTAPAGKLSINNSTTINGQTTPASALISLQGLGPGVYYLNLRSAYDQPDGFSLGYDDSDRLFEAVKLAPIVVSIADNDLPTAQISPGTAPSEVFSQPGYFVVKLNAPASAQPGSTGVKVNFKISGGKAILGSSTSAQDEYSVNADSFNFDPSSLTGWVRIAPGDVQANIGIIPVDNKLVSSVPLTLSAFSYNADPKVGSTIAVSIAPTAVGSTPPAAGNTYVIRKGTVITGFISATQQVQFTVRSDMTLTETSASTPYTGRVNVDLSPADANAVLALGANPLSGRLSSKDVQVTLLPGSGYLLPLAPDKQNLKASDPAVQANPANLDPSRTVADLMIYDDDVPGVRVARVGEDSPTAEGGATATYGVSLLAQPTQNVTVILNPQGNLTFVNPQGAVAGSYSPTVYTLDQATLPKGLNLDLRLVTVNQTDRGWTASFHARLKSVSFGTGDQVIPLSLADPTSGARAIVAYSVPAAGKLDAGGQPVPGNWNDFQTLVVPNLTRQSDASGPYFTLTLNLNGATQTIRINGRAGSPVSTTAATLTFTPQNWFQTQTVSLQATPDAIAEPGAWYAAAIGVTTSSADTKGWDKLLLPDVPVHIADTQLDSGATADAINQGFDALENSLADVRLPLVGNLLDFAPQVGDVFGQIERPLADDLKGTSGVTVEEMAEMFEASLGGEEQGGIPLFDGVTAFPEADSDGVSLQLKLEKAWDLADLDLSGDLGLDALGLGLTTMGNLRATVTLSISFTFGLSRTFGFYIDTARTGIDAGLSVTLDGFKATGDLGFLRLDLADDPNNTSALSIAFHAGLNDLDNYQTVRFFDVNGDGLLAPSPFSYPIGVDAGKDGRIDTNADGTPATVTRTVAEPWQNVNGQGVTVDASGKPADFPTVGASPGAAQGVNFNGNNTFDEAVNQANEGVYRTVTRGGVALIYFDANNNGKLDVGKRGFNPFTQPWTALSLADKDDSEIYVASTNTTWVDKFGKIKPFQIVTSGTGANLKYFFNINGGTLDAGEQMSANLRRQLDKNKDGVLNPAVQKDGEGTFIQGSGIAFLDANRNGQLDLGEKFVNSQFGDFQFSDDAFTTSNGNTFLDLDGTGSNTQFPVLTTADGTRYIDLNGNGLLDAYDPQAAGADPITVPSTVNNGKATVVTAAIVSDATGKFLDLKGNGVFDASADVRLDVPNAALGFGSKTPLAYFNVPATATGVAFFDADGNGTLNGKDYAVFVSGGLEYLDLDRDGQLTGGPDAPLEPTSRQNNEFDTSSLGTSNIVELLNDGDRLTLTELRNFVSGIRAAGGTKTDQLKSALDLFHYSFTGGANLGLTAATSVQGNPDFPSITFNLGINFPLFNYGDPSEASDTGFTVDFNDVTLDLGSFLGKFAEPVLATVDQVLTPFKPIVQFLNADTRLPAALGLAGFFESDGRPGTSLLEIALKFKGKDPQIDAAIKFASILSQVVDTVGSLQSALASGESTKIDLGDFSINDLRAASDDAADVAGKSRGTKRTDGQSATSAISRDAAGTPLPLTPAAGAAASAANIANAKSQSSVFSKLTKLDGFSIDILNPDTILSLLMGESDVDLITYDIPDFKFDFTKSTTFPIWGPLKGLLEGGFSVGTDLAFGFDTHGFEEWAESDFAVDRAYQVFDGFYVSDLHGGTDSPELFASAYVAAGAGIDLGIASGFVKGGVKGTIGLDLVDQGEATGDSDGKVRGGEIVDALKTNPLDLFRLNGSVDAFLGAKIEVDFFFFSATVYEENFATFNLAKFTLDSSGFRGSSDFGKIQGGPVKGATVWLDADGDGVLDAGEPNTITAADGSYQLLIPDGYDTGTGIVRALGGIDITTGLPVTTTFSGLLGESVQTPLTSLVEEVRKQAVSTAPADFNHDGTIDPSDADAYTAAFADGNPLTDLDGDGTVDEHDLDFFDLLYEIAQGGGVLTAAQAQRLILLAEGLDPSIDLGNTADFEGAIAGDPTSESVLVKSDETEALVDGLHAWLAGAAGLPFNDPATSALLTDAIDAAIARQIVTGRFDPTDESTIEAIARDSFLNARQALADSGQGALFADGDFDAHIAALAAVLSSESTVMDELASGATSGDDLARRITKAKLQYEGAVAQDLYRFGQGRLSDSDLDAADARTDAGQVGSILALATPTMVSPVADVVMDEDGAPPQVMIHAENFDVHDASLRVSVLSNNSDLIRSEDVRVSPGAAPHQFTLNFTPQAAASGSADLTVTFTDPSGASSRVTFRVTVDPVEHAPEARDFVVSASRNRAITFNPRDYGADLDGDSLSATMLGGLAHGTIVENVDGTFTYTPDAGFVGPETARYMISDGHGGAATGTITFVSTGQNDAPDVGDDRASTWAYTPVVVPVLTNDADANGDVLAVSSFSQGAHGTVSLLADGSLLYSPEPGFVGTDAFRYTASDGHGASATASVTVEVAPGTGTLSAPDLSFNVAQGQGLTFAPLSRAVDTAGAVPLLLSIHPPAHGQVARNADSTLTYSPSPGFSGADRFSYILVDGRGGSAVVQVTLNVTAAAAPAERPLSAPDLVIDAVRNRSIAFDPLRFATAPASATPLLLSFCQPQHGRVARNPDGSLTYTPRPGYIGPDRFLYTLGDDRGEMAAVTVTLHVALALVGPPPSSGQVAQARSAFVTTLYRDLLGRGPSPSELNPWLSRLGHGLAPARVASVLGRSSERLSLVRQGRSPGISTRVALRDASLKLREALVVNRIHPAGPPALASLRFLGRRHR